MLQGVWKPGQDISDAQIAQNLGVNRAPVREAMKLLSDDGWLTAAPQRSMTVAVFSAAQLQEAQDLYALRTAHQAQCGTVQGGFPTTMLHITNQRLQLAKLAPAATRPNAPTQR